MLLFSYITDMDNYSTSFIGTIILMIKWDNLGKALSIVPAGESEFGKG